MEKEKALLFQKEYFPFYKCELLLLIVTTFSLLREVTEGIEL